MPRADGICAIDVESQVADDAGRRPAELEGAADDQGFTTIGREQCQRRRHIDIEIGAAGIAHGDGCRGNDAYAAGETGGLGERPDKYAAIGQTVRQRLPRRRGITAIELNAHRLGHIDRIPTDRVLAAEDPILTAIGGRDGDRRRDKGQDGKTGAAGVAHCQIGHGADADARADGFGARHRPREHSGIGRAVHDGLPEDRRDKRGRRSSVTGPDTLADVQVILWGLPICHDSPPFGAVKVSTAGREIAKLVSLMSLIVGVVAERTRIRAAPLTGVVTTQVCVPSLGVLLNNVIHEPVG